MSHLDGEALTGPPDELVDAVIDAQLHSAVNRAYVRSGWLGLVIIPLFVALGLFVSLGDVERSWRQVSVPMGVAVFVIVGWWMARREELSRPRLFVLAFGIATLPVARTLLESQTAPLSPALYVHSPDFGVWLIAILLASLRLDRALASALGLWCGAQSLLLSYLAHPVFAGSLSGPPALLESLTRLDWALVRASMIAAFGILAGHQGLFVRRLVRQILYRLRHEELRVGELERAHEDVEQLNEAKSALLLDIGHDLRAPLNASLAHAESLLRLDTLDASVRESLLRIRESSEHLRGLAEDLLDVSTIESGRVGLTSRPVHLSGLLHELAAMVLDRARAPELEVFVEIDEATPPWVLADPKRLRQILLNLGTNALKFTPRGSICLGVAPGVGVRFYVRDTGAGIAAERVETLFQRFVQAGDSRQNSVGIGIGLDISQRLVSLMGGELRVESVLGEGSTFWFDVPLAPFAAETGCASAGDDVPPLERLVALRELAVDGNMTDLERELVAITDLDPRLTVFGRELIYLAQTFEDEALIGRLDQLIASASSRSLGEPR